MTGRSIIIAAMWLNSLAFTATAETTVIRPGPCSAQTTYLLADNGGALIRVDDREFPVEHVIIFRQRNNTGWASQRILRRFDLKLDDHGGRVMNSGAFCEEKGAG